MKGDEVSNGSSLVFTIYSALPSLIRANVRTVVNSRMTCQLPKTIFTILPSLDMVLSVENRLIRALYEAQIIGKAQLVQTRNTFYPLLYSSPQILRYPFIYNSITHDFRSEKYRR